MKLKRKSVIQVSKMWEEIFEQPEAMERCRRDNSAVIKEIVKQIQRKKPHTVVFAGRGKKLGTALMRRGLEKAAELGARRVELGAQKQAVPFYESLGFQICGKGYDDEGCPHLPMVLELSLPRKEQ